jgi:hypothetical protein
MLGVKGAGISTLLTADLSALDEDFGKVHSRRPHPGREAGILGRILRLQPCFTYTHSAPGKQYFGYAYGSGSGASLVDGGNIGGRVDADVEDTECLTLMPMHT